MPVGIQVAPDERLFSLEEFALAIGKSVRTVSRYVRQGRILTVTVTEMGRPLLRVPEGELFKVASSHDRQPPADGGHDGGHLTDSGELDLVDGGHEMSDGRQTLEHLSDGGHHGRHPMSEGRHVSATEPGYISANDMLTRYEAATVRLGWLEGQLDMTRRMLSDGGQREAELVARAEAEREARLKAEMEAARLSQERQRADAAEQRQAELAAELTAARAQLEQLQTEQNRSWWKKLFSGRS